jgi:hypothetical protein
LTDHRFHSMPSLSADSSSSTLSSQTWVRFARFGDGPAWFRSPRLVGDAPALLFDNFDAFLLFILALGSFVAFRTARRPGLGSFRRFRAGRTTSLGSFRRFHRSHRPCPSAKFRIVYPDFPVLASFCEFRSRHYVGSGALRSDSGFVRRISRSLLRISSPSLPPLVCAPRTPPDRPDILNYRNFRGLRLLTITKKVDGDDGPWGTDICIGAIPEIPCPERRPSVDGHAVCRAEALGAGLVARAEHWRWGGL